jgi:CBS domain-containing protein
VRRVLVITDEGVLHGIVSLSDVALAAGSKETATAGDVLATMKAVSTHPLPVPASRHSAA